MLKDALIEVFERDLKKLKEEINLYKNEDAIWAVTGDIKNSAGNLCLHLTGNLNHFIGATLGNSGYARNRDSEFALKNIPRKDLINNIENTIHDVKNALSKLSNEDFDKEFPVEFLGKRVKTDFVLFHLISHFNYHLGQINYHRRLVI
jgi:hypothetical protein